MIPLPIGKGGGLDPRKAAQALKGLKAPCALLAGPGLTDERVTSSLLARVMPALTPKAVVLDAGALCFARERRHLRVQPVLTPHAGELAHLLDLPKDHVREKAPELAREVATSLGAVVALKGAETFIASPDGDVFVNRRGNVGLATSGSGDTLSGVIAGLAARGAEPLQAAVWGVHLHAHAGEALARKVAPLGFLARELLDEIPALLARGSFARRSGART